jgi:hypothetical protein
MTNPMLRLAISAALPALALAVPASADIALPPPYLSRALDAVLLPIDTDVRAAIDLSADDSGVLVLATQPGGTADDAGIVPGDVLYMLGGRKVATPIEVDEIVWYWIAEGIYDLDFGLWRGGDEVAIVTTISEESYYEVIEITSVESWESWSSESFSYEEYYAEYSEELTESYEESETLIEESVSSEEFSEEMYEESYEEEELSEEEMSEEEEIFKEEEDASEEDMSDEDYEEEDSGEDEADVAEEEDFAEDEGGDVGGDEGGEE